LRFYERQEMLGMIAVILAAEVLRTDYAGYGLIMIFLFYRFGEDRKRIFLVSLWGNGFVWYVERFVFGAVSMGGYDSTGMRLGFADYLASF